MKVAVTGASGFVGRHLVRGLRAHGHAVRSLVRDLSTAPESDEARAVDLSSAGPLDEALAGVDAVVHAAAYLPASYADPGEARKLLEVNALGTLAVVESCVRTSVRKAVVFSSNVYRHGTDAVTEETPTYPSVHAPSGGTSAGASSVRDLLELPRGSVTWLACERAFDMNTNARDVL